MSETIKRSRAATGEQPRMNLGVFYPDRARPNLCTYARLTGLVPNDSRAIAVLRRRTLTDGEIVGIDETDKPLLRRANTDFLTAWQRFYGLGEPEPDLDEEKRNALLGFYQRQFIEVGNEINSMVRRYIPPGVSSSLEVEGEYHFPPEPSELYQRYISTDTKERERYVMGRQIALAIIAGELNANAERIHGQLGLVQRHLLPDLFGPLREKQYVKVYALHDSKTNKAIWISTQPDSEIDTQVTKDTHVKSHPRGVYEVEGIGPVEYRSRIKGPPGVIKAVRKALINAKEEQEDLINPLESVPDIMGMEFVVHGAFSSFDPKVDTLIKRVKDSLKSHFNLEDVHFEEKPFKEGKKYKGFFEGRRLMVSFPGLEGAKLEFMFHGLGDHINNTHNVGTRERNTGKRSQYQAHALMEIERDVSVLQLLFPEKYFGEIDWDAIVKAETDKTINALKRGNKIKPSEVRVEFIKSQTDPDKSTVSLFKAA